MHNRQHSSMIHANLVAPVMECSPISQNATECSLASSHLWLMRLSNFYLLISLRLKLNCSPRSISLFIIGKLSHTCKSFQTESHLTFSTRSLMEEYLFLYSSQNNTYFPELLIHFISEKYSCIMYSSRVGEPDTGELYIREGVTQGVWL